jgi:hypothetical protein
MRHAAVALVLTAFLDSPAVAQGVVIGFVREDSAARVLPGVEVLIEGTRVSTRTDSAGGYVLDAPAGARVVLFRSVGFRATRVRLTVVGGDTVRADARLLHIGAQELEAIAVEGAKVPRTLREAFGSPGRSLDGSPGCWTTVILDGLTIYRSRSSMRPPDFRRDFPVMSLDGIEYYPRASTTPMEFANRGTDCGVLVLWTRRGP